MGTARRVTEAAHRADKKRRRDSFRCVWLPVAARFGVGAAFAVSAFVVWVYLRDRDEVSCETRPAQGGFALVISHKDGAQEIQHWPTAEDVDGQRRAVERRLLDHGWQLKAIRARPAKPGGSETD